MKKKKKNQLKFKNKEKLSDELLKIRNEVSKLESKLQSLGGGDQKQIIIKDIELNKMIQQIEKEDLNILKFQSLIEKRNNEIKSTKIQLESEIDNILNQNQIIIEEKKKLNYLIKIIF